MTQGNKRTGTNTQKIESGRKDSNKKKDKIDTMIRGYQEMAEINLAISKLCFEVEREVEDFYDRLAECE